MKHGDEWGEPSKCESGDSCQYCHSRTEQQFHPEVRKLYFSEVNMWIDHSFKTDLLQKKPRINIICSVRQCNPLRAQDIVLFC